MKATTFKYLTNPQDNNRFWYGILFSLGGLDIPNTEKQALYTTARDVITGKKDECDCEVHAPTLFKLEKGHVAPDLYFIEEDEDPASTVPLIAIKVVSAFFTNGPVNERYIINTINRKAINAPKLSDPEYADVDSLEAFHFVVAHIEDYFTFESAMVEYEKYCVAEDDRIPCEITVGEENLYMRLTERQIENLVMDGHPPVVLQSSFLIKEAE